VADHLGRVLGPERQQRWRCGEKRPTQHVILFSATKCVQASAATPAAAICSALVGVSLNKIAAHFGSLEQPLGATSSIPRPSLRRYRSAVQRTRATEHSWSFSLRQHAALVASSGARFVPGYNTVVMERARNSFVAVVEFGEKLRAGR